MASISSAIHNGYTNGITIYKKNQTEKSESIVINGKNLTLEKLVLIARHHHNVELSNDADVCGHMEQSVAIIHDIVSASQPLYGVTSLFGGLANRLVCGKFAEELQNNLVCAHKTGSGSIMPLESIRAAMVLRANAHLIGASGIRRMWDERLIRFVCEGVTPLIPEFGSIGASGDLVPLSYIASAISGQDEKLHVDFRGEMVNAPEALRRLGYETKRFNPKEGLALLNGTSMMTACASLACYDLYTLMAATLHIHAIVLQALTASNQPFHPFLQKVKSHPGQVNNNTDNNKYISYENSAINYHTLDFFHFSIMHIESQLWEYILHFFHISIFILIKRQDP
uniref:Histidine ammonia-lyase-like protein n=1 Tax=Adineta vaga TaxID=104782 RepID=B3G4D2_ADIVA|nr:histidine ammonia-lyase-like protein [Adineta vaga]